MRREILVATIQSGNVKQTNEGDNVPFQKSAATHLYATNICQSRHWRLERSQPMISRFEVGSLEPGGTAISIGDKTAMTATTAATAPSSQAATVNLQNPHAIGTHATPPELAGQKSYLRLNFGSF